MSDYSLFVSFFGLTYAEKILTFNVSTMKIWYYLFAYTCLIFPIDVIKIPPDGLGFYFDKS